LEEKHPMPALVGGTPEERAETRMWTRRVELNITEHLYNGFRFAEGLEMFKTRLPVIPEAAAGLKATVQKRLAWLDGLMEGRSFLLAATRRIPVATGIANIWARDAMAMAAGQKTLAEAWPGRFLLGIGVSHAPIVGMRGHGYDRPLTFMRQYLDAMDAAIYNAPPP